MKTKKLFMKWLLLMFFSVLLSNAGICQNRELVIIDPLVNNYQTIINQLSRQADVVVIPVAKNPLVFITDELAKRKDISAVHLFVMCKPGSIVFDQLAITETNMADCMSEFAKWFSYMNQNTEILIYGSELASSETGIGIIKAISKQTGAVVRASTDISGPVSENGNWELEYSTGKSKVEAILNSSARSTYNGFVNK